MWQGERESITHKTESLVVLMENFTVWVESTLTDTINPTLNVLQAQSLLVKPAAAFTDPIAISKTGS
jgi:hypothetical protein